MKSKLFYILALVSFVCASCSDESSLIINSRDVSVDNPDGNDSDEGDHNTEEPGSSETEEGGEDEHHHDDDEQESDPCQGGDDCSGKPVSCDECVPDTQKCDGNTVLICATDEKGCLTWRVSENCASQGKWCDSSQGMCASCSETCEAGTKQCQMGGIAECVPDAHGCAAWQITTPCGVDEHCDEITMSCVSGCESVCKEGDARCNGSAVENCYLAESGCMAWKMVETCESSKTCVDNPPKCERACGDDCEPFTLVLIPDPQNYTASKNGIYKKQTQWIADNKEKENIRFVMNLGDITDGNRPAQFERAVAAHDVLVQANIPQSMSTGNHDYKEGETGISFYARDRSLFPKYFNDSYFQKGYADSSWFGGFKLGANMYATFNVGHMKFGVIALEFFPRKEAICWASNLLSNELKDHYVIVTTHGYLANGATESASGNYSTGSNGNIASGALGVELYNELISRHSNIIMVVSGHVSGSEHRYRKGHNGNQIVEMLVNYQSEKPCTSSSCKSSSCDSTYDAGNGWLRLLKIDPKNVRNSDGTLQDNVVATTFSVLDDYESSQNMYCSDYNSSSSKNYYDNKASKPDHAFTFALDFSSPRTYQYSNGDSDSFITRTINEPANDVTDGDQYVPAVSMNRSTGDFVAAWEDDGDKDGNHEIFAKVFCAGGCDVTPQFRVNPDITGMQSNPDIAMDKHGNFVVVWEDDSTGSSNIYMRGYDDKGNERFGTQLVHTTTSGDHYHPAIAMDDAGQYVVVWQDHSQNANSPQIYMRGFKADGTERFAERNVLDSAQGKRKRPDIGMATDGSYVVTWEDDTESNDVYQIIAKGFAADGSDRIPVFTVNTKAEGQQLNPSIGMNASGTFFITYEDDSDGNGQYLIMTRGFDHSGNEFYKDTTLAKSNEKAVDPVVCVGDDNMAVFSWAAMASNSGNIQKRVLTNKQKLKDEDTIHRYKDGPQITPAIACAANGRHVILFADDNKGRGTVDIFGRGYN